MGGGLQYFSVSPSLFSFGVWDYWFGAWTWQIMEKSETLNSAVTGVWLRLSPGSRLSRVSKVISRSRKDWDTGATPGPIAGHEVAAGGKLDRSEAARIWTHEKIFLLNSFYPNWLQVWDIGSTQNADLWKFKVKPWILLKLLDKDAFDIEKLHISCNIT